MSYPDIEQVGIMHATTPEDAEMIAGWVRDRASPTCPFQSSNWAHRWALHGGPGVVAMIVVEGEKAEGA